MNGKITLFPPESEYQLRVADVLPIAKAPKINLTVNRITTNLSNLIQKSVDLQGIQVHGDISNFDSNPKRAFWLLSDTNIANPQRIHCVFFDPDKMAVGNRDQVRAEGNIQIFGAQSRYQINIAEVQLDGCECSGCGSCQKIDAAPQCKTLPDPKYKLCSACYVNNPDHEKKVEKKVEAYFSNLKVKGFSPKTQHEIQMGSNNRKPDVVLIHENGSFAAIAECKGAGFIGDGIDQLKSYLSATDTRFGVFANRADRKDWEFYENRRRNQFDRIDRSEFETGIVKGIATRKLLKDQIRHLENYKSELHEEIHRKLEKLLEKKIQRLESPLSDLKIELQKRGIINWLKNLFSKEHK